MSESETVTPDAMEPIHISTTLAVGANRRIIARARGHEILMDIPKERGGDDVGPTPPECLALALGGCVLNMCRVLAMQERIVLEDIRVSVTGEVDPSRAFGIATDARAGFSHLSVLVEVGSELSCDEKEQFRRKLRDRCPLCDTIDSPTPLQIIFA
ncbi:MAG: OsmC family protein [Syntrophobacteraceae bacterium]